MKRKYLDGSNWAWLAERSYKWMYVDGEWKGYVSLVKMGSVKRKLKAHYNPEICLCDDRHNEIVEWYFDMTKENGVDERNIPYFEDLYLDVIVAPDFSVHLIDEDELQEALDEGTITKEEYDLAYRTYEKLVEEVIRDEEFLTVFLPHYLEVLDH